MTAQFFTPRALHPAAWWGWAIGCAVVATRTTNLILTGLVIAICCLTVVARRTTAPWAMAFRMYVYLAVFIVVLRLAFRIVFSANGPTVIMRLPVLALPRLGVRFFGPVSAEALLTAGQSALQLAAMVLAIGAANALANPKRLLAAVPSALYEWGAVVVIALTVFPQLAESLVRVRRARQLRVETGKGAHLIRNVAMPVLSDALDRSLLLAAAMDSRGYGRSALVAANVRHLTSVLLIASSLALCAGAYGLLDTGMTPMWMGAPMVVAGLAVGFLALRLAGKRVRRTRYRPDSMRAPEWVVLGSAVLACAGIIVLGAVQPTVVYPAVQPLGWPPVTVSSVLVVLLLVLPAFLSPEPQIRDGRGDEAPSPVTSVNPDQRAQALRPRLLVADDTLSPPLVAQPSTSAAPSSLLVASSSLLVASPSLLVVPPPSFVILPQAGSPASHVRGWTSAEQGDDHASGRMTKGRRQDDKGSRQDGREGTT